MWKTLKANWQLIIIVAAILVIALIEVMKATRPSTNETFSTTLVDSSWIAPSLFTDNKLRGEERELVKYFKVFWPAWFCSANNQRNELPELSSECRQKKLGQ